MRASRFLLPGAVIGVAGTALLLVEGLRAIALHDILGTVSQLVMWVGLGVMAVGGVLLIGAAWEQAPDHEPAAAGPDE
ncbi:MAG TPA: hypothetical protein VHE56_12910 [Mycobacteriales bacterium]|nr:hypothetical protein [Mycobacteriales bacterium]